MSANAPNDKAHQIAALIMKSTNQTKSIKKKEIEKKRKNSLFMKLNLFELKLTDQLLFAAIYFQEKLDGGQATFLTNLNNN